MLAGLVLLMVAGLVPVEDALAGFAHPAVVAVAALFVVAAGMRETGATAMLATRVLGQPTGMSVALTRLTAPVALLSGFINNTPVVAMYVPIVGDWARRIGVSASKLMMPLSFASLLGGQLSLIGSASNLIVMALYLEHLAGAGIEAPSTAMRFWGPAILGLPAAGLGLVYLVFVSPRLIPDRRAPQERGHGVRSYTIRMVLQKASPLVGQTIGHAGLRNLPGLYLFQIERDDILISAPPPNTPLAAGDRLGFAGMLDSVIDLQRFRGLVPAGRRDSGAESDGRERHLTEAVVAAESPLVGRTVREVRFRTVYDAAVVAVRRHGADIRDKIGNIRLEPGDTLLLEAPTGFEEIHGATDAFYLVSPVEGFHEPRHNRLGASLVVFGLLVSGLALSPLEPVVTCLSAAVLMVATGCLGTRAALASVSLPVVVALAAALGMSAALQQTGAAASIAKTVLDACQGVGVSDGGILFVMMLLVATFSQLITKNGSAALLFPVAMAVAQELGVHPEPFAFSLILGAGLSFLSPIAYQTNLMVYGPGGYKYLDFARVGLPLTLILAGVAAMLCPLAFPFRSLP